MGKTKGPYNAEYPPGTLVRIAERQELEEFRNSWRLHHPVTPNQLEYAGMEGKVSEVAFYHGGDELYQIEGVPGIWHEVCLTSRDE